MERYLRVNLLAPGPRFIKKEFTGPRSHNGWETLPYGLWPLPTSFLLPLYLIPLQPRLSVLSRGLPLFPVLSIVTVANRSGICWCHILLTWPYHPSRRDFINFTISVLCNMSFTSLFVLTLHHVPSSTGPYIFFFFNLPFKHSERLRFFLGCFPSLWPISHCGAIRGLYDFNLVLRDSSFDLSSFVCT